MTEAYSDGSVDGALGGSEGGVQHLGITPWEAVAEEGLFYPAWLICQPQSLR